MTRPTIIAGSIVALALGLVLMIVGLVRGDVLVFALGDFALNLVGWGTIVDFFVAAMSTAGFASISHSIASQSESAFGSTPQAYVGAGAVLWVLGWAGIALSVRGGGAVAVERSVSGSAPLNPRLAKYRDVHWGTLAAYGFGILFSQLGFIVAYLLTVGKGTGGGVENGLSPISAFVLAFSVALIISFGGGFIGSRNSRRLSIPETTVALLYFGLPVPILLSLIHSIPQLMLAVGYRLREVVYLSSLLGENRPELGYWLVTLTLFLSLFFGISFGFVTATGVGSSRAAVTNALTSRAAFVARVVIFALGVTWRLTIEHTATAAVYMVEALLVVLVLEAAWRVYSSQSYELFIATRHVSVFDRKLLGGVFVVLLFLILPPLIIYAFIRATQDVVERNRIRRLGARDPLAAAEAMNALKLRAMTPTTMMTAISVLGVGLGVMSLIIVLSVMSGFEADLQQKILGTNSHGLVMKYSPDMPEYEEVMGKISKVRGVKGQTPFILNEVMVSSDGNVSGSMIKGVDPKSVGTVTDLPSYMLPGGSLEGLDDPKTIKLRHFGASGALDDKPATPFDHKPKGALSNDNDDIARDPLIDDSAPSTDDIVLPGIVVGRELASSLKVIVGDRINVISPIGGELGPQGPMPKSRPFRVAGIFYSGMFEYDSKFVYIHLREAQSFFNVKGATGIEIKVDDVDNARNIMKSIYDGLEGYPYRTKDWGEMNRNLFSALRLEKLVMGIILSMITIVAACLIVATVIMLVLEKRKEIAVLKALGVSDGGIVRIFLIEGLQIGVAGGVLGLIAGLALCVFIERVGIKLDPQVYYIPALPVRIEPFQTALSVIIAILVSFLASIYPALKASQVEPVDGLKSE